MNTPRVLVLSLLALGVVACKPVQGLPRLEAKGPPPAPTGVAALAAPDPAPAQGPVPVCACPQDAKAPAAGAAEEARPLPPTPTSIHDGVPPPRAQPRPARPARRTTQAARQDHRRFATPYRQNAYGRSGGEGFVTDYSAGGDTRRAESVQSLYAEHTVEERSYEWSSESHSHQGGASVEAGYAEGGYIDGGYGQGAYYGGAQSGVHDYSVGRPAWGDAARSRAWTRVRGPDGHYRYERR